MSVVQLCFVVRPEWLYSWFGDDKIEQLLRRLTAIVYHWKEKQTDGSYKYYEYELINPVENYTNYEALKEEALSHKPYKEIIL